MFQLELGQCPVEEDAVQLRTDVDNGWQMRQQCLLWKEQLDRVLKNSSHRGAAIKLKVKSFDHDFGTYYEVVAICDDADESAITAAFWLEENLPTVFDDDLKRSY